MSANIISGLSGFTVVRNGILGDYCMVECINSLLAICEEVVVGESDSTDGTREFLQRWADNEPRLRIEYYPWTYPKGDLKFFTKWLNWTRERLRLPHMVQLDCDEVLDDRPEAHARIRVAVERQESLIVDRLNFWNSARTLIPEGHCCCKRVTRVGKSSDWLPSDEGGYAYGDLPILDNAVDALDAIKVFHLGFLRKAPAFYRKARVVLEGFFGETGYDPRLAKIEATGKTLQEIENVEWVPYLVPYMGYISDAVQRWFADRGHATDSYLAALPLTHTPKVTLAIPKDNETINVRVAGDFGDIIAGMPIMRELRRVRVLCCDRNICKPLLRRLDVIKPLLESQPYIVEVKIHEGEPIHWDESDFRTNHQWTQSLHRSHLLHYNGHHELPRVHVDLRQPWLLNIEAAEESKGRVIINRTPRYNNDQFPWRKIVDHLGEKLMFIGLESEWQTFCREFGHVEFRATNDLLEVAQLVRGSELVIAGQSCVLAIAEGLKHPRIAEVTEFQPDVVVTTVGPVQYVADGRVKLPAVGDRAPLTISPNGGAASTINTDIVPPNGWQYPGVGTAYHFKVMVQNVSRIVGIPAAEAKEKLLEFNGNRCPDFFHPPRPEMVLFQQALQNAMK